VIHDTVDEVTDGFQWGELRAALRRVANDSHPPLSFVVQAAWTLVFSDSLIALRSLSMLYGVLTALFAYMAVREALGGSDGGSSSRQLAPTVAAVLIAIHLGQVSVGATARMYALGALLSAVTAWLLLRALRMEGAGWIRRWTIYGIGSAAFVYTHNFAIFNSCAHGLFVALLLLTGLSTGRRMVGRHAIGFLWSSLLAFSLYGPWLPVAMEQAERIEEGFWINPLTWQEFQRAFVVWILGDWIGGARDGYIWQAVLLVAVVWRFARLDSAAIFFLLQALTPWVCVVIVSGVGPQSILQDRYMVFSQVGLLCFWAVVLERLRLWPARLGWAMLLLAPAALVTAAHLNRQSSERSPIERTVQRLARDYLPGDVVLLSDVATLNRLRYYARRAGCDFELRVPYWPQSSGQAAHVSSLRAKDVLWSGNGPPLFVQRIWTIQDGMPGPGATWEQVNRETICDGAGMDAERFDVRIYGKRTRHASDFSR
jgi:hypothetical protein